MRPSALFIATLLFSLLTAGTPAFAENNEGQRTLSVRGTGSLAITPNMVTIRVGVSSRDASPAKALKDNTRRVTQLFKTLERFGLKKRDIQTSSFNVNPVYSRRRPQAAQPTIEAYDVTNMVTLRLRDLTKLGALLEALVSEGTNRLNGLSFGVSNSDVALDEARKLAIRDAKRKALLYAKEAEVTVGKVLNISEDAIRLPRPRILTTRAMTTEAVPIAAGEQHISASVSVIFEIK